MADPELLAHREWLGYVQPVGVVVSPSALLAAQAYVNRNVAPLQQLLLEVVEDNASGPAITHLGNFVTRVLRWDDIDLLDAPTELERALPEYGEVLRATYAVREVEPENSDDVWLMLVTVLPGGAALDAHVGDSDRGWNASPQVKFERLLRETRIPIGLMSNGTHLRLIYAPRGETSGHITFPVAAMAEVAGRPILAALDMLLGAERLFTLPTEQRLSALLADSRRYQNDVSTRLAGQVLAGLYELLRGFQAADDRAQGALLRDVLRDDPDLVYEALLTVLLRLVFLLYAEDRDLMPPDDVYNLHYSVGGLFDRLREGAGRYPDTIDLRYGAWAQLLSLFRIVYDGVRFGGMHLPSRHGHLFDPDRFPFLEGRAHRLNRVMGARIDAPFVSDGVVWRVLQNLVVLDGERLSYRSLDVEQIGSVYETMMGFRLEIARGHSFAIKPTKPHGAPITIDVDELLTTSPPKRAQWIRDEAEQKLTEREANALASAATTDEVEAAIERKIDRRATPTSVPAGAMILQPNEERRRSGSFYTPRSLTEPIVRTTLRPLFDHLGENPTPEAILDLKLCDPAMGSGAFLVEACRQLSDKLVDAWHGHDCVPAIPPDSDEVLHARRLVAHRCLYGVDRNPIAVDLAKLSLWLATLARDHAFTFLDHALRCGDSLVGLTPEQIVAFHWSPGRDKDYVTRDLLRSKLWEAEQFREQIRAASDDADVATLGYILREADDALDAVRLAGDLVVLAFFSGTNARERQAQRDQLAQKVWQWQSGGDATELRELAEGLRDEQHIIPFHWQIEFPEVFDREPGGFDAIVGNPPFLAGRNISGALMPSYLDWLVISYPGTGGQADLVSYFFRRSFDKLRTLGCFGLVATNTIAQGDTRHAGLKAILSSGGTIYAAIRRLRWPGGAAVVVSIVHVSKQAHFETSFLDGNPVAQVTAYLFTTGGNEDPARLVGNRGIAYTGGYPYGSGFLFDDHEIDSTPVSVMRQLVQDNPANSERIRPYIGGSELLNDPHQQHKRFVIDFGDMTEEKARRWPDLFKILEEKVKPERAKLTDNPDGKRRKAYWWQWGRQTPGLDQARARLSRVLMHPFTATHLAFAFVDANVVVASPHPVLAVETFSAFAVLQSRLHEIWARFFGSSFKDDLRYTASDVFETFPLPPGWSDALPLEAAGRRYYESRAELMTQNAQGLTKTYNRFHDPTERQSEVLKLRECHAAMDRVVLDSYGWTDIPTDCEFLLDYETDDEDNSSRKKPWRYRWPDGVRDEVLARLLALNAERAEAQRLRGDGVDRESSKPAATAQATLLLEEA